MKTETLPAQHSRTQRLVELIARTCGALARCEQTPDTHSEWIGKHGALLDAIESDILPSGSGIDCGTKIDREHTDGSRVTLTLSYHHMDENGGYDGWSDYRITARPSFEVGISLTITGQDRNGIKEYLAGVFQDALGTNITHFADGSLTR